MQFKVVSALIFATLAAAGSLPRADANIAPPVPGKTTIGPSECSSGHLRCCKFHFSQDRYSTTMKTDYYYRQERPVAHFTRCDPPSPSL